MMNAVPLRAVYAVGDPSLPNYIVGFAGAAASVSGAPVFWLAKDKALGFGIPISLRAGVPVVGTEAVIGYASAYPLGGMTPIRLAGRAGENLGYAWAPVAERFRTVSVASELSTDVLTFDLEAGGAVSSWIHEPVGGDEVELLNYRDRTRGIQVGMEWFDPAGGEFKAFAPRQGGDRYTATEAEGLHFGGGRVARFRVVSLGDATTVEIVLTPVEFDPDGGVRSGMGIEGGHGGGLGWPVVWPDMTCTLLYDLNHRPGRHQLTVRWSGLPRVETAFLPVRSYVAMSLDELVFDGIASIEDGLAPETLASTTVGTPGYGAEARVYTMGRDAIFGDDEVDDVGPSQFEHEAGFVGASAFGSDLLVGFASEGFEDETDADGAYVLPTTGFGNCMFWSQIRDRAPDDNAVFLGHGHGIQGRLTPHGSRRIIRAGEHSLRTSIMIGTEETVRRLTKAL